MKNVRHVADILETAGRRDSRERPAATRRVWCRQPGVYFSPCDSNHDGAAGVPLSGSIVNRTVISALRSAIFVV